MAKGKMVRIPLALYSDQHKTRPPLSETETVMARVITPKSKKA